MILGVIGTMHGVVAYVYVAFGGKCDEVPIIIHSEFLIFKDKVIKRSRCLILF